MTLQGRESLKIYEKKEKDAAEDLQTPFVPHKTRRKCTRCLRHQELQMAHVKVVRRSMRPEEWTKLRFGWLQHGIYREKAEITGLEVRDARQTGEDTYE